ncbi:MAG: nucleotidyltransferase [Chloroflexi bacterium]|nr:MAG: nucleotidyltransferase [Chloroflexota bacterium]
MSIDMERLAEICRRYQVRELALFGSVLRDDFSADSDVDVLVEFEPEAFVGLVHLGHLQEDLERVVGRRVDLVPKRGLKLFVRDTVLAEAEVIYAVSH